jgi:TolB protein
VLVAALGGGGLSGCGDPVEPDLLWGRSPSWSADGRRLAFDQNMSTAGELIRFTNFSALASGFIWVVNADGTNPLQITFRGQDLAPSWAPNNDLLAFVSEEGGQADIWVMNAAGGQRMPLTNDRAPDLEPAWSPDGTRIAYASSRGGDWDIWIMNADGSGATQLTAAAADDTSPAWSPDSRSIAFASNRDQANWDLWAIDVDGTNLRQVTSKPQESRQTDGEPAWSPDGTQIAYASWNGNWDVWVVNADGTGAQALTNDPEHDGDPAWSPDSRQIAFASARTSWWHVYVMDRDGSNVRQITGQQR